ncbi:unnamed protein product [Urochloa humidicola]
MAMASGGEKSELGEGDYISRLPDAILGEIVSLLPAKDGGRTQVLASRWRHLWGSAPLNLDLQDRPPLQGLRILVGKISGILSSHPGPGRRFSIPSRYLHDDADPAATLDGWLRSPALDGLQELEFHYGLRFPPYGQPVPPKPPLLASARRFSPTLRVAYFGGCSFPDGDAGALHLPLLKHLSLMDVAISEGSLYALLAGCPVLQSLVLTESLDCCTRIRIVSRTLRSIGVHDARGEIDLEELIIEDAPCLERLLFFGQSVRVEMVISVISAPKLEILGQLPILGPRLEFGATAFQGSCVLNSTMVVPSVKVLALSHNDLNLDMVIDFMKCFPCLENLYIKLTRLYIHQRTKSGVTNAWCHKYRNLDIRLKKIVVTTYRGNEAHVNFAKFFVLNAGVLESMVLEVDVADYYNKGWIERQQTRLEIENRASKGFDRWACSPD